MTSVYTRRFALHYSASGADDVIFTADSLHTYVLRDVRLHNRGTVTAPYLGVASGTLLAVIAQHQVAPGEVLEWQGQQVLLPGDQLHAGGGGQPYTVIATGWALSPGA